MCTYHFYNNNVLLDLFYKELIFGKLIYVKLNVAMLVYEIPWKVIEPRDKIMLIMPV